MNAMGEFQSWEEYNLFAHFIKFKARHVLDERSKRFLQVVVETSGKRRRTLPQQTELWRAQIGHDWRTEQVPSFMQADVGGATEYRTPHPFGGQRMLPLLDRATEGRVNPKGIPCVYFSMGKETAMSEVRPWIGSYVSVAQFETLRALRLVDFSGDDPWFGINYHTGCQEPTAEKRESSVWGHMNLAFSEPITRSDDIADYAPTQVLAEVFRDSGYDGIIYESRLGEGGKNVALFRLDFAGLVSRRLYRVDEMKFEFTPVSAEIDQNG
jgi:hypothetical protein